MFPLPYAITDIHAHVSQPSDLDELVARGKRLGITRFGISAVFVGGREPSVEQCRRANDVVLAARDRHRDAALPFCYLNPCLPDEALAELERCILGEGMVGVKLWIAAKASDPRVVPIARRAAELRAPVLQHAWYKVVDASPQESTPADVAVLARRVPEATIIMAHLLGGGQRGIADVAPCPNVYPDCCGGEPEVGLMEQAVARLGPERVLYGSDAAGRSLATQLAKVLGARIPDDAKRMILSGNAKRILPCLATT